MHRNEGGMSLLEVMIGLGIAGIAMMATMSIMQMQSSQNVQNELSNGRAMVTLLVQQSIASKAALAKSLLDPRNKALSACLYGGSDPSSKDCLIASGFSPGKNDFVLLNATGSMAVAGGAEGVYYDRFGNPCDSDRSSCALIAKVWFQGACPDGTSACNRGKDIDLHYRIEQNPAYKGSGILLKAMSGVWAPETTPEAAAAGGSGDTSVNVSVPPVINMLPACVVRTTTSGGGSTTAHGGGGGWTTPVPTTTGEHTECCVSTGASIRCYNMSTGSPAGAIAKVPASTFQTIDTKPVVLNLDYTKGSITMNGGGPGYDFTVPCSHADSTGQGTVRFKCRENVLDTAKNALQTLKEQLLAKGAQTDCASITDSAGACTAPNTKCHVNYMTFELPAIFSSEAEWGPKQRTFDVVTKQCRDTI